MIQLHFSPSTASMVPHIVLEEIGVPYERIDVKREQQGHKRPEYLAMNPNGLIPVLQDGPLVVYETAAVTMHLVDKHPQARLAPAVGSAERAFYYQWMAWLTNTLQSTMLQYFYPDRYVAEGNAAGAAEVKAQAERKIGAMLDQLDGVLARHGGEWFAPWGYSALDAYVLTLCRWTRNFKSSPARDRAHLGPYLQRMLARPAVQRVMSNEGLAAPYV
jgi:glutathione S-transferase